MSYPYNFKVVVSGKQVEVYKYQKYVWRGFSRKQFEENNGNNINNDNDNINNENNDNNINNNGDVAQKEPRQLDMFEQLKLKKQRMKSSLNRTKTKIRRLTNANPQLNKFMTLTFAKSTTNIKEANYIFNQFIKRIVYRYPDFEYLAVPEFQKDVDFHGRKKENGGSIHYHLICNMPYIEMDALEYTWGQGMVNIRQIGKVNNLGAYISKYLGKEMFNGKMFGKKKFFRSQSLFEAIEILGHFAMKFVEKFCSLLSPVFEKTFESEWIGEVTYTAYSLEFIPFIKGIF